MGREITWGVKYEVLGISGSPVPNSNTDRLVLHVLQTSGLEYEFVKLSQLNVGPCRACKACVKDNVCQVPDDFPELAKKLNDAKGLVLGGYTPYGTLDASMNAFWERLWSMRQLNSLNEQKYLVTIISELSKQARGQAHKSIAKELFMEKMEHVAQLDIEDQQIWEKAAQSGKLLAQFITEEIECWLDYE